MNRRGFLLSCLAAGAAPAIARSDSLMKLWTPKKELILPYMWGPGEIITVKDPLFGSILAQIMSVQYYHDGLEIDATEVPNYSEGMSFRSPHKINFKVPL